MYRSTDLKTGLLHVWGWMQNHNVADFTIADSLTQSETGQFFQEVHPLMTLDNIKSIAPDFSTVVYPDWVETNQYRIGDRVKLAGKNYRAKAANIGLTPEPNTTEWERFDPFSEWLEQKTQGSILKAIRTFWDEKMASKSGKNILENKTLFNGTGRITDLIPAGENLVGFELVPIRVPGVTTKIERIGLQFTGVGETTLYLMHSSRKEPIREIDVVRTRDSGMMWFDMDDLYLPYVSKDIDAGGSWYLVYKQSDLGQSRAINRNKDWSAKPCSACDANEMMNWRIWSSYLEVHPFKVSNFTETEGDSPSIELWDISENLYTYSLNYGINIQLSIECDITDLILDQRRAFQNIIGLQVAIDMIREMAYNPNFKIGRTQQNFSRLELLYELDGDSQGYKKSGLVNSFNTAMKAVSIDSTGMSKVCFPCNNGGIRYKTT